MNGCSTSPVAFLEGLFVKPSSRGTGVGRSLCAAAEAWAKSRACAELASDSLLENTSGHAFHLAAGFEETERVIYYRKHL